MVPEENDQKDAFIGWTNDALPQSTMKELINKAELIGSVPAMWSWTTELMRFWSPMPIRMPIPRYQAIYEWAINERSVYP